MSPSSRVSPDQDSIIRTSDRPIMPRSPCDASAGWTKWAGVPVLAKVAASLRATWPDLPIPARISRPSIARIAATVASSAGASRGRSACTAPRAAA